MTPTPEQVKEAIERAMHPQNRWYKNCKNVRKRGGLICNECPFREMIENVERINKKEE